LPTTYTIDNNKVVAAKFIDRLTGGITGELITDTSALLDISGLDELSTDYYDIYVNKNKNGEVISVSALPKDQIEVTETGDQL
jgi:hypothetical protein